MFDGRWASRLLSGYLRRAHSAVYADLSTKVRTPAMRSAAERLIHMSGLKSYKELDAWKVAMTLVESVYRISRLLPDTERYGLIAQMQRSAVSIPSNIAEGQARGTVKFGLHFLSISIGSSAELATLVELVRRLRYLTPEKTRDVDAELERLQQLLYGMRREHLRRLTIGAVTVTSLLLGLMISRA